MYKSIGYKGFLRETINQSEIGKIRKYVFLLRKDEYFAYKSKKNLIFKIMSFYYRRKRNKLGCVLGMNIPINTCGRGLLIYHSIGIIIHRNAKIGNDCKLHGMNCIGNKGENSGLPIIGDRLDLGVGASIIGPIQLNDDIKVAANSVVTKSISISNVIVAGSPARELSK